MRSGVGFPSYADQATYAMVTGTADANYPVQNLSDLTHIRQVFSTTAAVAAAFTFVLPAARAVQLLALIHHSGTTAGGGDTMRWRLFSDNNPDPVGNAAHMISDSGVLPLLPGGASPYGYGQYPQVSPYRLSTALNVRSGRVDLSASTGPWIIGGLEIAGFWEWQDVSVQLERGYDNKDVVAEGPFDVDYSTAVWGARTIKGQRAVVDQSEARSTGADFFYDRGLDKPFLWAWDLDDTSTYPRECVLVRNQTITPPTMNDYPSAAIDFDFVEHLR